MVWLIANWDTIVAVLAFVASAAKNFSDGNVKKEMSDMFNEQKQSNSDILSYAKDKAKNAALRYLSKKLL